MAENMKINPNTADEGTLAQIPGLGGELANRIIHARPFESLEDLKRVNGIGPVLLESISSYLEFAPPIAEPVEAELEDVMDVEGEGIDTEPEAPPLESEIPVEPDLATEDEQPPAIEEPELEMEAQPEGEELPPELDVQPEIEPVKSQVEKPVEEPIPSPERTDITAPRPTKPGPKLATRSQLLWVSFASGLLAFILAFATLLGVLAGINDGLRYASSAQIRSVSQELNVLSTQIDVLEGDMQGLRMRMDNLEGLSGRVDQVEEEIGQLTSDVDGLSAQVRRLNQQVDDFETRLAELENQVGPLQEQSARFQNFFDGLRDLMENVFPSEVDQ